MKLADMYLRESERLRDAFMEHIISDEHRDVCRGSCLVIDVYAAAFVRLKDAAVLPSPDPRMYPGRGRGRNDNGRGGGGRNDMIEQSTTCYFPGCTKPLRVKGLCGGHYKQTRDGRTLRPLRFVRPLVQHPGLPGALLVPLTKGYSAIIDEVDGPAIGKRNWHASQIKGSRLIYAKASVGEPVYLHLAVAKLAGLPPAPDIDHRNGDGLDCRRNNLRPASHAQNIQNVGARSTNTSGYKGASWRPHTGRWAAVIVASGKRRHIGYFATAEEAGAAYEAAARELHGEFARPA